MSSAGRTLAEIRARFDEDRARVVEYYDRGGRGSVVVRRYRRLVDATLSATADVLLEGAGVRSILAVGGFGRGDLAFHSDVDLFVLHETDAPPEEVRSFLQALWDLGWDLGHRVVTPSEALAAAASDPHALTACLEMRSVWGDREAAAVLERSIREEVLTSGLEDFIGLKRQELERRHHTAGDTAFLAEPDVKESPGGLRDLHTLLWISAARGGASRWREYLAARALDADSYERLQNALDLLYRVRNGLHLLKGRRWDRLDHRSQVEVAERLGHRSDRGRLGVEAFMRAYYRAARDVLAFTRLELARAEDVSAQGRGTMLTGLAAGPGAHRWEARELEQDPVGILARFARLSESSGGVDPDTAAYLLRQGAVLGRAIQRDAGHGPAFMRLLCSGSPAWSLQAMHRFGILGGVLPEFQHVDALVQFDPYHHYTVDEHTLRMIDALERLAVPAGEAAGEGASGLEAARSMLGISGWSLSSEDLGLLRLAVLFHDTAKGTGAGRHAERGARMLRRAGRRLRLPSDDLRTAAFLVRHHLLLSASSQRRDIRDPALTRRLGRIIRTPRRLKLLTLLTICDLSAVGPGTLTVWKARLLADLYELLEADLEGRGSPGSEERAARLLETLSEGVLGAGAEFLAGMPPEYLTGLDPSSLQGDMELAERFQTQGGAAPVIRIARRGETTQITLAARDRHGLLSQVCGVLAASDLNILRARIFTRLDGTVFDRLTVTDAASGSVMTPEQEESVLRALPEAVAGTLHIESLLHAHRDRWRLRDRPRMLYPVRVEHDRAASDRYTVLEVRAHDQVGLLYGLTHTIAEAGAEIHQAFITTEGERAVDAFYLTDPLGAPLDGPTRESLVTRLLAALSG